MIVTFFCSAIVHEYILIVTFQFFFPVLFIMFFGFGGKRGPVIIFSNMNEINVNQC